VCNQERLEVLTGACQRKKKWEGKAQATICIASKKKSLESKYADNTLVKEGDYEFCFCTGDWELKNKLREHFKGSVKSCRIRNARENSGGLIFGTRRPQKGRG